MRKEKGIVSLNTIERSKKQKRERNRNTEKESDRETFTDQNVRTVQARLAQSVDSFAVVEQPWELEPETMVDMDSIAVGAKPEEAADIEGIVEGARLVPFAEVSEPEPVGDNIEEAFVGIPAGIVVASEPEQVAQTVEVPEPEQAEEIVEASKPELAVQIAEA